MEHFEGQNWGNVKKFEIALRSEVNFPENKNQLFSNEISFINIENFTNIPFILESAFFGEIQNESSAGIYWDKKAGLKIPKLRNEVSMFLEPFEGRKLVARITDMNGEVHLLFPLKMQLQRKIDGTVGSLNHTLVEFSGQSTTKAPFVLEAG